MMKNFNLTEWSLKHRQFTYYILIVMFLGGIFSYKELGRMEDPDFTIREMVVSVYWPGATARQVEEQVTDKVEKKLQETPGLDYLKSYSKPGQSVVFVSLKEDTVTGDKVHPTWLEVRNLVNDMKDTLPQGASGPYFNDQFDDVFGCIYALTGDGYSYEDLRVKAENIRRTLLGIPSVKKVDLLGVQTEKVYVEIETSKLAELGLAATEITTAIQAQNAMTASGMIETSADNVYLRVSGMFDNIDDLKKLDIRSNGRTFKLGDIARIERSYVDPPEPKMFYNGQPAIGLALSMEKGGNILALGNDLEQMVKTIKDDLPLGLEMNTVTNQPTVVTESINEFVKTLAEAVAIVLLVSFASLGLRSGVIVAICIPLVIAGVFVMMDMLGIALHKVSLGALIIALGLLVDDAIIAIEMMIVKLEQGWTRDDAACHAFNVTAIPMLTGTLITCAGFIPVGFSKGSASEFVGSIFTVITIALLISWIISVMAAPLFGYHLLQITPLINSEEHKQYSSNFYVKFRKMLVYCLNNRRKVLSGTVICFVCSILLLGLTKQEFFPASTRNELIVELQLPEGASMKAIEKEANRFAERFADDNDLASYTYYLGGGAPRFVLTVDPPIENSNFAQFVFVAKDLKARANLEKKVQELFATDFINVHGHTKVIQTGTNAPYPVMLRFSGPDIAKVRSLAVQARDILAEDENLKDIKLDWNEKSRVLRLNIDQAKARALGIDNKSLSTSLQAFLSGGEIGEFREKDKTIGIVFRIDSKSRQDIENIKNLNIQTGSGQFVPLDQIASVSYEAEEGMIWRRDLKPTITLQAVTAEGVLGDDAALSAYEHLTDLRKSLPAGYKIEVGGAAESSEKAMQWLMQPVPAMIIIIITLLMLQIHNIPKMIITLLTAPLGMIGVSPALLLSGKPMGFVVQLGILALAGIIIRNSVILIDQIDRHINEGEALKDAIINATVTRFRPIMLTASAAILGMIPLISSVFWGPMAVAIAGGLFAATVLTLFVLPVMYATLYKAKL